MDAQALAGRAARAWVTPGWRARRGDEPDAAVVELGEDGLGGELGVGDQQRRVMPGHLMPVVGEGDDLPALAGLGQVSVGIQQGVGASVLGEEGEHRAGALGAARHVVLLQHRVLAPVHYGVEVQVQRLAARQPGGQGGLVEGGQEHGLPAVLEPVGVGGQRGGFGQRGQRSEQCRAGVGGDVIKRGRPAGCW
jgi:hypothetical protein